MIRNILLGGVLITAFLLWTAWEQDYNRPDVSTAASQENVIDADMPQMVLNETGIPSASTTTKDTSVPASDTAVPHDRIVTVKTDVLLLEIDRRGGNVISAKLLDYLETDTENSPPIQILNNQSGVTYIAQSGLMSEMGPDTQSGQAVLTSKQSSYVLSDNQDTLEVPLTWTKNGVSVTKTFVLKRGQYLMDVQYTLNNRSDSAWVGQFYGQFKRDEIPDHKSNFLSFATYNGAAISTPEKRYQKVTYDDMKETPLNISATDGWVAMLQHYFVSAWIPDPEQNFRFVSYPPQQSTFRLALLGPTISAQAGETIQTSAKFYVGPEVTEELKKIAPGLELTVDYGWFWPISQALFWVMKNLYDFFGNWGWAIIVTTLLIKIIFYKLSATSYRSMANMRRVQPKMEKIKERVGDDRQKLSQEMMALYKKEKINPLGGCLPILVQIPVFIALYWVLIESVELRHSPFILWIHDLSAKDPFYILPLIMGASMFLQQKMSPAPPDPVQAKILMFMPVVFTALFLNFPAGLVLYWVVNNVLSIAQQWMIMRSVEKSASA